MGKTRKRNNDAFSRKRPWSDLNDDVLHSVMIHLGVVDFLSFSGVCKSWRSLALSNRKRFMASKPPLAIIACENTTCKVQDFQGNIFKTILPHSAGRACIGVTCGYLILFGGKTRDFRLVNLITSHQLHFPDVPFDDVDHPHDIGDMRAILVFSPSLNGLVFVVLNRYKYQIWFSVAGKGKWNHVSSAFSLVDLHPFKGKIYILGKGSLLSEKHIFEMKLDPVPKLTLLDTHFVESDYYVSDFFTSHENLYLMEFWPYGRQKVHKLQFHQLTWVHCESAMKEYALFYSCFKHGAAVKPDLWAAPSSQYKTFFGAPNAAKDSLIFTKFWYFTHDSLNVTLVDE